MDRHIWNELSTFQTNDLIRREYESAHGGRINAEKTREIFSCFVQGQEYFRNAANADETVRPLLLYYGVTSLSIGIILFINRKSREASLPPKHGLQQKDWSTECRLQNDLLQLKVKRTDGIFNELWKATENRLLMRLHQSDCDVNFGSVKPPLGETSKACYKLGDVLSRIPQLFSVYQQVTKKNPNFVLGSVVGNNDALIVRFSNNPVVGIADATKLRSSFQLPHEVAIEEGMPTRSFPGSHFITRLLHEEDGSWSRHCPKMEQMKDFGLTGNLIAPWPNGGYISPLLRCFLASFFLGILVRYNPSIWMALIRNEKGDAVIPLLRAAMDHVEHDFPHFVYSALTEYGL